MECRGFEIIKDDSEATVGNKYGNEVRSIDSENQMEAAEYKYFMTLDGKKRLRKDGLDSYEACSDLAILPHGIDN
jgi:hypothetical protein